MSLSSLLFFDFGLVMYEVVTVQDIDRTCEGVFLSHISQSDVQ